MQWSLQCCFIGDVQAIQNYYNNSYMFSMSLLLTKQRYLFTRKLLYSIILILFNVDIETCLGCVFSKGNFTVIHQNVCELLSKRESLKNLSKKHFVKIYGVTETHSSSPILWVPLKYGLELWTKR